MFPGSGLDLYENDHLIHLGYDVNLYFVEFKISFQNGISLSAQILGCPIFSKGTPISVQGAFVLIR